MSALAAEGNPHAVGDPVRGFFDRPWRGIIIGMLAAFVEEVELDGVCVTCR